jgi:alkylation response protein AidB-like acyl-CoA dehydrogenase
MASDVQQRNELQGAVRDLLRDLSDDAHVRAVAGGDAGFDAGLWDQLLKMGVLELAVGSGRADGAGGYAELAVVFEELGYALAPVPALSTVGALTALDLSGSSESVVSDMLAGTARVTIALSGDDGSWGMRSGLTAAKSSDAWALTGIAASVPDLVGATAAVVVADTPDGPAFFLVSLDGSGVEATAGAALDLTRPIGDLRLTDAPAQLLAGAHEAAALSGRVSAVLCALLAAENTGVAARALDTAVAYAKVRVQFGRQIGSFQAIKHSCVDMLIQADGARGLVEAAAGALDVDDPKAALHVATAAAYAAEAAVDCSERCLQAHGGIGYTWEHSAHLLVRRAKSNAGRYGQPWEHWERAASELAATR